MELELCCNCQKATGKAGAGDDSLYCRGCGEGPFCEYCYDVHEEERKRVS